LRFPAITMLCIMINFRIFILIMIDILVVVVVVVDVVFAWRKSRRGRR